MVNFEKVMSAEGSPPISNENSLPIFTSLFLIIVIVLVPIILTFLFSFPYKPITKVISDGTLFGTIVLDQVGRSIEYTFSTTLDVSKLYIMRHDETLFIELTDIHVNNHKVYGCIVQDKDNGSLRNIIEELNEHWEQYYVMVVPKKEDILLLEDP